MKIVTAANETTPFDAWDVAEEEDAPGNGDGREVRYARSPQTLKKNHVSPINAVVCQQSSDESMQLKQVYFSHSEAIDEQLSNEGT